MKYLVKVLTWAELLEEDSATRAEQFSKMSKRNLQVGSSVDNL